MGHSRIDDSDWYCAVVERAVSQVTGRPIWRLVEDAVTDMVSALPTEDQRLVGALGLL